MKITPLEIRQQQFEKVFRGYDKDEVGAFLLSLSHEWERVLDEQKELKFKLEASEKEVQKLREVESSLFKTLKTAEDTGANMIDQATKAAQLHLKESQMNAEQMLTEAKERAKAIIEKAEGQSQEIISEMQEALKDMEQNYKAIENYQEDLISELNNLSKDIQTKVGKMSLEGKKFSLEDHMKRVKKVVRASKAMIEDEPIHVKQVELPQMPAFKPLVNNTIKEAPENQEATPAQEVKKETTPKKPQVPIKSKLDTKSKKEESEISFFDQIDD